ncbi:MAG: ABC transporter substrate-binding protein [Deltaproteobacteria bacterium]|nr:ABC transporter substrate-binding protein [Deltaproteobacteria bacterium]
MRKFVIFGVFFVFFSTSPANSAQPLDVIRLNSEKVIEILKDTKYDTSDGKKIQRDKLWEVISEVFDFREMARRALARYWRLFSDDQKTAFSQLFSRLLGGTYLDRIQRGYRNEKVLYLDQDMLTSSKAVVKTKVLRDGVEIPVSYSLIKKGETWSVYDVNIEGVSLVKNYRKQFSEILIKRPPAQLIEMLKKKVN